MPPSEEGGGFCEAKDGGRDMISYNKQNIPLAKALRKNMTPWERKLWYQFLKGYPIRFQRQKAIGNYIADFYCAKAKLVIELDGSQHYSDDGISSDNKKDSYFQNQEIKVLRFPNLDVDKNFHGVAATIDFNVQQRL